MADRPEPATPPQTAGRQPVRTSVSTLPMAKYSQCKARHRHPEFMGFLRHIEASVSDHLDVRLVVC
jgi:hypothetical protein